ncbi:transmembrane amino acid transporter [Angomonas deanei]|uniref:Tryptophan/tyrosine permease family/Transmembrane amino acid transporter protein, putative n=1 Tax=Angomonas deanei TaxID=59799 RepID=A0A7G2CSZ2_9TRYP|nr:transmembrane amino acid transporter [Angomonas deanei]CAD2221543.1 Tryptophan/tyrosine permease family/Transmembrane amino acid transporter protein, putative [Angomonas deanei]|eukprot:EPY41261.1 transmembrane amino acid transporter [Angomonas deanei]
MSRSGEPYGDSTEKVNQPEIINMDNDEEIPIAPKRTNCFMRCMNKIVPPGGLFASALTLCSSTLGAGILGLSAAFNDMGLVTALIILIICVFLTIFSLWLLAIAAERTGIHNYPGIVHALLGRGAGIFMAILLIINCIGGGVSYIVTLGDILKQIFDDESVPHYLRTTSGLRLMQAVIWAGCMLPLCIWKKIDSLRFASVVGVLFMIYFVICLVENSGRYLNKNGWPKDMKYVNTGNSVCRTLGTIIFACQVQMNAFEIYHESANPSSRTMFRNASFAMGLCGVLYVIAGVLGYAHFGSKVQSSILLQYQPRVDKEFWPAYFGIIFKLCIAYALHQLPMRDGLYYFLKLDVEKMNWCLNAAICAVLAAVNLILGIFIPDLSVVLGLTGSLTGSFIAFIIPAFLYMYCGNWHLRSVGFLMYFGTWFLLLVGGIALTWGTIASLYGVAINGI